MSCSNMECVLQCVLQCALQCVAVHCSISLSPERQHKLVEHLVCGAVCVAVLCRTPFSLTCGSFSSSSIDCMLQCVLQCVLQCMLHCATESLSLQSGSISSWNIATCNAAKNDSKSPTRVESEVRKVFASKKNVIINDNSESCRPRTR